MEQALVILRLQEARKRAIFHQTEDLPLSRDETQRTRSLETLADDVARVEIQVHLQEHVKRDSMMKPGPALPGYLLNVQQIEQAGALLQREMLIEILVNVLVLSFLSSRLFFLMSLDLRLFGCL